MNLENKKPDSEGVGLGGSLVFLLVRVYRICAVRISPFRRAGRFDHARMPAAIMAVTSELRSWAEIITAVLMGNHPV